MPASTSRCCARSGRGSSSTPPPGVCSTARLGQRPRGEAAEGPQPQGQHPQARGGAHAQPPGASGRDVASGAERGRRSRPRPAARRRVARMARAPRPARRGHAPASRPAPKRGA
jgi:hypothetical protein